ncbi:tetratricopeptide repeat protein [Parvibaculaceae bacterium PLY_AMNH_Bact1]|nr:tetratricopeptide repeat protein [Parvibaculaceae bacterium PLY_AMNH_Bact1]
MFVNLTAANGAIRASFRPCLFLSFLLISTVLVSQARAATSEEEAAAIASLNAGTAAIQSGRALEAIDYLNAAIEGNALDAERMALAYHHRGIANQKLGLGGHAVADYTSAIWQGGLPASILPRSYYNRAVAYAGMGQQDRAARDYDKAIELAPNYASAFHNRGNLRRHMGRHNDAIVDYDRALTLGMGPRAHLTYFARALSNKEVGNERAALEDAAQALELKADFAPARTALTEWDDTRLTQVAATKPVDAPIVTASIPEPTQTNAASETEVSPPSEPTRDMAAVADNRPSEYRQASELDGIRIPNAASSAGKSVTLTPPNVAAIEPQSGNVTVRPLSEALPPPRSTNNGWQATVTRFVQPPLTQSASPSRVAAVPSVDPMTTASIDSSRPTPVTRDGNLLTPPRYSPPATPIQVAEGTATTTSDASPAPRGFRVQIGSFRSASDATAAWDKTVAAHQELIGQRQPYIVEVDLGARGIFYRLQIGPLHSSNEAKALCNALKARGQDCILAAR